MKPTNSRITRERFTAFIKDNVAVGACFRLPETYSQCLGRPHNPTQVDWQLVEDMVAVLLTAPDKYQRISGTMFKRVAE